MMVESYLDAPPASARLWEQRKEAFLSGEINKKKSASLRCAARAGSDPQLRYSFHTEPAGTRAKDRTTHKDGKFTEAIGQDVRRIVCWVRRMRHYKLQLGMDCGRGAGLVECGALWRHAQPH